MHIFQQMLKQVEYIGRQSLITLFLSPVPVTGEMVRCITENADHNAGNAHHNEADATLQEDAAIAWTIESRVEEGTWHPNNQRRVQVFDQEELKRVRLYSSNCYLHSKLKYSTRKACLLCYIDNSQKRKSSISCRVCKILLCTTHIRTATLICFELWHSRHDPKAVHTE